MLLLWGWLRNRVLTRRELRFDPFIALVGGVEKRALELQHGGTHDCEAIRHLHQKLCTIKDAALERVAVGDASDQALVTSLFSHIGDVRAFLSHLEENWNHREAAHRVTGSNSQPDHAGEPPSHVERP
jgi:hypothetical protein